MLKAVFAATAALTIAGSMVAYAQPRDGRPDGARRGQPTTEDMRAFQAARLAALRAGLVLTSEQERHWPAFEAAMRELQQQRLRRITAMRDARREGQGRPPVSADPAERMRQRAARLSESGAVLKRLADATDPLYRSLDDAQKRRFAILARAPGPRGGPGWHRRWRGGDEPGMPRGPRRSDAGPTTPPVERMFGRKDLDDVPGLLFSAKLVTEEPAYFSNKVVVIDPAMFDEATPFRGKHAPGLGFSRKITIGEPTGFGRKAAQSI